MYFKLRYIADIVDVCMVERKTKQVLLSSFICYCYVTRNQRSERKQKSQQEEGISLFTSHSAGAYHTKKLPGAVAREYYSR